MTYEEVLGKVPHSLREKMNHSAELLRKAEKLALAYDPQDGYYLAFSGGKYLKMSVLTMPKKHWKKLKQAEQANKPPTSPIVVYYRVSTKKQDFDTQRLMTSEWLKEHGLRATLTVEEKISGSVHYKDRKLGTEVLPALKDGGTLLVQAVDRLSRNAVDFGDFLEELEERGVRLITVLDNVDHSTQG